jgi:hypothetical protein
LTVLTSFDHFLIHFQPLLSTFIQSDGFLPFLNNLGYFWSVFTTFWTTFDQFWPLKYCPTFFNRFSLFLTNFQLLLISFRPVLTIIDHTWPLPTNFKTFFEQLVATLRNSD